MIHLHILLALSNMFGSTGDQCQSFLKSDEFDAGSLIIIRLAITVIGMLSTSSITLLFLFDRIMFHFIIKISSLTLASRRSMKSYYMYIFNFFLPSLTFNTHLYFSPDSLACPKTFFREYVHANYTSML